MYPSVIGTLKTILARNFVAKISTPTMHCYLNLKSATLQHRSRGMDFINNAHQLLFIKAWTSFFCFLNWPAANTSSVCRRQIFRACEVEKSTSPNPVSSRDFNGGADSNLRRFKRATALATFMQRRQIFKYFIRMMSGCETKVLPPLFVCDMQQILCGRHKTYHAPPPV